jgi:hypothetical protein
MTRFERVTFLPHARERMEQYAITAEEVRSILEEPNEEGAANSGRSYAEKLLPDDSCACLQRGHGRRGASRLRHAQQEVRAVRISYDKESGAFTIYFREGKPDHAEDLSKEADVYADAEGLVRSLEALSFEELRLALEECGGNMETPNGSVRLA